METVRGSVPSRLVERIRGLVTPAMAGEATATRALGELIRLENAIDVARVLHEFSPEEVTFLFDLLELERQAIVLSEADPKEQALLLMHVGDRGSAELLSTLEPDDAADVLEVVREDEREEILKGLEEEDAEEIRSLQGYQPETAGGLMTPLLISVSPEATYEEVLGAIRGNEDAETIHVIFVTEDGRLRGVFSVRDLLVANPGAPVSEYMTKEIISVEPDADQEDVIRLMETYHLVAIPVVDRLGNLLGLVTADDALSALEDEASQDVMAMAGAGQAPSPTRQTVMERVRARMPWLLFTLFGGIAAAAVIRGMEAAFGVGGDASGSDAQALSNLKNFLPLVAGLAGNVGMQSSAVMVRGFATGEIDRTRVRGVIHDEILVALIAGFACGLVAAVVSVATSGVDFQLNLSVGLAIALSSVLAGACGAIFPMLTDRIGVDPAIAAGPFITMLNDLLGFCIFMAIALALA